MHVEIREEPLSHLPQYGRISMAFEVDRIFDVTNAQGGPGNFGLVERPVFPTFVKDYDAEANGENRPATWPKLFDLTNWGILSANCAGECVGGIVIAFRTAGLDMLDGRTDFAVIWDLRVSPVVRRCGVASALFAAAEQWARAKGCRQLKIETQNINVPACKFYARQGCELRAVHRFAYPQLPDEIQFLWYKDLSEGDI